ncbi:unnamed protein product [Enterobius vermicularis]|uniref:Vacuolar protein sorting-associated protein 18 homolog n=1 Tax=Enterobius vermicularis TaxID=51028 RepID=A0A0N4VDY0_ENTVE|nr:unnamed protein product [Enterobius vermicularis]
MASSASKEQDGIFVGKLIDFRPKGNISHVVSSNGQVLLATNARDILHISVQNLMAYASDIALPLSTHDRIAYVHIDVAGYHAILSSTSGENFYVNLKNDQQKPFKRAKGHVITAIGWNSSLGTESETAFIALGTTKGSLYETSIQSGGSVLYMKELSQCLTGVKELPITNVELFQCDDSRWALCICFPGRLYCLTAVLNKSEHSYFQPVVGTVWTSAFVEQFTPTLQPFFSCEDRVYKQVFLNYFFTFSDLTNVVEDKIRFHCMDDTQRTLPSGFAIHPKTVNGTPPTQYCWLGAHGFTIGKINITAQDGYSMIIEGPHVQHRLVNGRYDNPLDIAVTEYHVLLLYSDRLEAVSLLNQKCVYEEPVGMHTSQVKGMFRDPITEMIWVYTDSSVSRYQPNEENRNVWAIYLEQGDFKKAKKITSQLKDKDPHQLVLKKEADKLIAQNNDAKYILVTIYVGAAELLAESTEPFEIAVSRFLSSVDDRRDGLKRFLELQFEKLAGDDSKVISLI